MRTIFIALFLFVSAFCSAQLGRNIFIDPQQSKGDQHILISHNGKQLLSERRKPNDAYHIPGHYSSILLTDLVEAIKVQVRQEISDSIATVDGGSSDSAYYAIIQQSGGSNPTETKVFQNDFGTPTWEHDTDGVDYVSFSGLPVLSDTSFFITITMVGTGGTGDKSSVLIDEANDRFIFYTWNSADSEVLASTWDMFLSITKKE